jgi:ferredoxin
MSDSGARLSVDEQACTGHGRCYPLAPGLLSDDDEMHPQAVLPGDRLARAAGVIVSA